MGGEGEEEEGEEGGKGEEGEGGREGLVLRTKRREIKRGIVIRAQEDNIRLLE